MNIPSGIYCGRPENSLDGTSFTFNSEYSDALMIYEQFTAADLSGNLTLSIVEKVKPHYGFSLATDSVNHISFNLKMCSFHHPCLRSNTTQPVAC